MVKELRVVRQHQGNVQRGSAGGPPAESSSASTRSIVPPAASCMRRSWVHASSTCRSCLRSWSADVPTFQPLLREVVNLHVNVKAGVKSAKEGRAWAREAGVVGDREGGAAAAAASAASV